MTDVTSSSGTSLWWMEYTPFGAPRASGSTSQAPVNLFRFTGEYADTVTALYHLRARQYDPATGRFLSPDPVSPTLGEPSGEGRQATRGCAGDLPGANGSFLVNMCQMAVLSSRAMSTRATFDPRWRPSRCFVRSYRS